MVDCEREQHDRCRIEDRKQSDVRCDLSGSTFENYRHIDRHYNANYRNEYGHYGNHGHWSFHQTGQWIHFISLRIPYVSYQWCVGIPSWHRSCRQRQYFRVASRCCGSRDLSLQLRKLRRHQPRQNKWCDNQNFVCAYAIRSFGIRRADRQPRSKNRCDGNYRQLDRRPSAF